MCREAVASLVEDGTVCWSQGECIVPRNTESKRKESVRENEQSSARERARERERERERESESEVESGRERQKEKERKKQTSLHASSLFGAIIPGWRQLELGWSSGGSGLCTLL